jgi:hypothetical protein
MEAAIAQAKELNPKHESLYREKGVADLADVGPYLFQTNHFKEFKTLFTEEGWGNSWGVMLKTNEAFATVHTHFRKFLLVKTEDGEELYFRFYDPRVLRIFLPTCDTGQIKEFFGPVQSFYCEDEDPAFVLVFELNSKYELLTQQIPSEAFINDYLNQEEKEEEKKVKSRFLIDEDESVDKKTNIENIPIEETKPQDKPNKTGFFDLLFK